VLQECLGDLGSGAFSAEAAQIRAATMQTAQDAIKSAERVLTAAGLPEAEYRRLTYDLTLSAAGAVAAASPGLTFIYVSGQGTDSTEAGRIRWARVKGATENALRELPMRNFAFRPGFIQPLHGITSKTPVYALAYRVSGPLLPVLRGLAPNAVTTTEVIGRAMIAVAEHGYPKPVLETRDLNAAAE